MNCKEVIELWNAEQQTFVPTEVVLVQCFGLGIVPGEVIDKMRYKYTDLSGKQGMDVQVMKEITIYDENKVQNKKYLVIDYLCQCPAEGCGKLMHVQALAGTIHLPCCSAECYAKYWKALKGNIVIHSGVK